MSIQRCYKSDFISRAITQTDKTHEQLETNSARFQQNATIGPETFYSRSQRQILFLLSN